MKKFIKLYTRELEKKLDNGKVATYNAYKGIVLNNAGDDVVFVDIQFYIKKDDLKVFFGDNIDGEYLVNIAKSSVKTLVGNDGQPKRFVKLWISEVLSANQDELDKFKTTYEGILEKRNVEQIEDALR